MTADLKECSKPHIDALKQLLYEDFRNWLINVTGIPLNQTVDMNSSRYDSTDVLLCHDDKLEGRRIAYILYLVPPWTEADGGCLDLFAVDELKRPDKVVKSLVPSWNTLVFFEVSPVSFHQVAEVLSEDKTRLSVNGWFHGPNIDRPEQYTEPALSLAPYISLDVDVLHDWLNPDYLDMETQLRVRETFESDSEIELPRFFKDEKYQELLTAIQSSELTWERRGPANIRNYESADESSVPEVVRQCLQLFRSDAMFVTLSNLTGLSLHELCPNSDDDSDGGSGRDEEKEKAVKDKTESRPRCFGELRHWQQGSYTMLTDTEAENADFALDAFFFCKCDGWKQEFGGFTSYIAKDEDEELMTVNPEENSLALVYCDKQTLRFIKHVNHKITTKEDGQDFYDIAFMYLE
ncbi:PREDICTED: prolyl 3-hydroxylase OGFOD1-like isoform X2 [Priapulus caudatus]|uniref:uS12 prolyl 3-hydroxylase n=1 Tax=Priapulus caudatus TaxID=37621 RepID=A0ABM1EDY1_PRICU|nr:PREDICTED: prolyl 3-hydroxylase OGFOD1-like isoform X2 [Priapulus caudatus]